MFILFHWENITTFTNGNGRIMYLFWFKILKHWKINFNIHLTVLLSIIINLIFSYKSLKSNIASQETDKIKTKIRPPKTFCRLNSSSFLKLFSNYIVHKSPFRMHYWGIDTLLQMWSYPSSSAVTFHCSIFVDANHSYPHVWWCRCLLS